MGSSSHGGHRAEWRRGQVERAVGSHPFACLEQCFSPDNEACLHLTCNGSSHQCQLRTKVADSHLESILRPALHFSECCLSVCLNRPHVHRRFLQEVIQRV